MLALCVCSETILRGLVPLLEILLRVPDSAHVSQLVQLLRLFHLLGFQVLGRNAIGILPLLRHFDLANRFTFHFFHLSLLGQIKLVQHLLLLVFLVQFIHVFYFHSRPT